MNVSGLVWEMIPWWILGVMWVFLDGGLPSAWFLLIYPEFIFCLQCLLLAIFHPLTPTLLLGCKFRSPIIHLELSSSSLPKCQNSIWKAEFSSQIEYVVSVCDAPSPVCFRITKIQWFLHPPHLPFSNRAHLSTSSKYLQSSASLMSTMLCLPLIATVREIGFYSRRNEY